MSGTELARFGAVSDEIAEDPEVACRTARELGMEAVDLNSVWGKPVTALGDVEVGALGAVLRASGMRVHLVAGLPFKALPVEGLTPQALLGGEAFARDMAVLERSLQIAQALGAPCARVHAFAWPALPPGAPMRRPGGGEIPEAVLPTIAAGLRAACALAAGYGLKLGLENVRASYANCGRSLARVCAAVGDSRLRVVWDPANAFAAGEDDAATGGYAAVAPLVDHVHVKDVRLADATVPLGPTEWECVGRGAVDWPTQLRALRADGYAGLLCVETHWSPPGMTGEQATRASFSSLLRLREGVVGQ